MAETQSPMPWRTAGWLLAGGGLLYLLTRPKTALPNGTPQLQAATPELPGIYVPPPLSAPTAPSPVAPKPTQPVPPPPVIRVGVPEGQEPLTTYELPRAGAGGQPVQVQQGSAPSDPYGAALLRLATLNQNINSAAAQFVTDWQRNVANNIPGTPPWDDFIHSALRDELAAREREMLNVAALGTVPPALAALDLPTPPQQFAAITEPAPKQAPAPTVPVQTAPAPVQSPVTIPLQGEVIVAPPPPFSQPAVSAARDGHWELTLVGPAPQTPAGQNLQVLVRVRDLSGAGGAFELRGWLILPGGAMDIFVPVGTGVGPGQQDSEVLQTRNAIPTSYRGQWIMVMPYVLDGPQTIGYVQVI